MSRLPGFLHYANARAAIETQYQLFASLNSIERRRAQAAMATSSPFSVAHAVQGATREQNRYSDILPYRHSQVLVGSNGSSTSSTSSSDTIVSSANYINANRITAPAKLRNSLPENWPGYIATQAPLPQTQSQFWRMVYEQNAHVIVCLTAVHPDRSHRAQKAERYWPLAGETDSFKDNSIHVKSLDTSNDHHPIVAYRHFQLWDASKPDEPRRPVLLVYYQGWPDHGVPKTSEDLRNILYAIRTWKSDQKDAIKDFGPTVVHCSAGCGRTGTFCVVDTALSVLEYTGYPYLRVPIDPQTKRHDQSQESRSEASTQAVPVYNWQENRDIIFESLESFREERMLMVQTAPQYSFCYQVVQDLCQ
ncbi:hypothetical protein BGZ94_003069 [Podila epigama]|nr:hypothetical protein BGZ94_003069 [Podila epigama]